MRYSLIMTGITLFVLAWLPNPCAGSDSFCRLPNFAWTEGGVVARAAQPSIGSLACLYRAGFAAVVNLRHESPQYIQAAALKALGMDYLFLPLVDDTAPSPAQVSQYMNFVDAHRRLCAPVLIHDAAGRGRMGAMDGIYLLWKGWATTEVFERYIHFGAKIDCENGGNGQIQALHELGKQLGRGDAWPKGRDQYGNAWENCPRPDYMANWDYRTVEFPTYRIIDCSKRGQAKQLLSPTNPRQRSNFGFFNTRSLVPQSELNNSTGRQLRTKNISSQPSHRFSIGMQK